MNRNAQQSDTTAEASLPERFIVRTERFEYMGTVLNLTLPRAADELLDELAFVQDERMPYWADLWPSAKALARFLLDHAPAAARVIELGCGLALPSMALRSQGIDVLATDYDADALLFVRFNAQNNRLGDFKTLLIDWRDTNIAIGSFDLAIAADVLYEQRNASALVDFLPRILKPSGRLLLADPGRRWAGEFRSRMRQIHWNETELEVIEVSQHGATVPSKIQITEWKQA